LINGIISGLAIVEEKVTDLVISCPETGAFWQERVTAAAAVARNIKLVYFHIEMTKSLINYFQMEVLIFPFCRSFRSGKKVNPVAFSRSLTVNL